MQILSKNFELPQKIRNVNNEVNTNSYLTPSFKSSKTKVIKNLSNEVASSINFDSNLIKDIFKDSKKRALFMDLLGATIAATVANLVNALSDNEEVSDSTTVNQENSQTITQKEQVGNISSEIKFDATKGVAPKLEKDFIAYVEENFEGNQIIFDRLKLLFNKFAAHNRKCCHIIDGKTTDNKNILEQILAELKSANTDAEKINEIINKYQGLVKIDTPIVPSSTEKVVEIDVAKDVKSILDRYKSLKEEYYNIMHSSKTKAEATQMLKSIDRLILAMEEKGTFGGPKNLLSIVNQNYNSYLGTIALIYDTSDDKGKDELFTLIRSKDVLVKALENWSVDRNRLGCSFPLYNELVKADLNIETMKKVILKQKSGAYNNIKILPEDDKFQLSISNAVYLNTTLFNINGIFELITGKKVTLKAEENEKIDDQVLTDNLIKDFKYHSGNTSYPNLVKYLYGKNFVIYNENSFQYNKVDHRLNIILRILNDNKLFNPNFFSPHCKLRFLERFVLNENFSPKSFEEATSDKVRMLINSIKKAQAEGITIKPYYTPNGLVGVRLSILSNELGDFEITLDDKHKIHTIF